MCSLSVLFLRALSLSLSRNLSSVGLTELFSVGNRKCSKKDRRPGPLLEFPPFLTDGKSLPALPASSSSSSLVPLLSFFLHIRMESFVRLLSVEREVREKGKNWSVYTSLYSHSTTEWKKSVSGQYRNAVNPDCPKDSSDVCRTALMSS